MTVVDPRLSDPDRVGSRARVVAFYLPQFHPIPENDEWWGAGFTEWTNVARARPLFPGHRQPHLPADLGFYDLRVAETRELQAEVARRYGVEAFCYWHYWFAGRRILERPYEEMLSTGKPDFPFCLAWANQTWSGIWHGAPDQVLIEQTYPGQDDDERHFRHVLPAFRDSRYLRVDGKPLFYVFRPELLPDAAAFVERWQSLASDAGLGGLYLVAEVSDLLGQGPVYSSAGRDGFDAGVYIRLPARPGAFATLKMRATRKLLRWPEHYRYASSPLAAPPSLVGETIHPCVYPNWDNTPRSGRRGLVLTHSSPESFRIHVRAATETALAEPPERRLLFVKSWNEWAEGNYLEPDLEHGHGFLEALADETVA
jgi:lipopolysaccharide biosynthesis protein